MVTDIFAKLGEIGGEKVFSADDVCLIHYRRIFTASKGWRNSIVLAYGRIHSHPHINREINISFIQHVATSKIDAFKPLDEDIFLNHFVPRLRQLTETSTETSDSLETDAAKAIRSDMANLCHVALYDYKHIHDEAVKQMESALP